MLKKLMSSVLIVLLVVIVSGVAVLTCDAKDTLVIGIQDVVASLDPAKTFEMMSYGILHQVYENLVTFKEDDFTQPIPELAESWEVKEDGKTWIFHMRKGITFASGNPVNAEAVVFSLRRLCKLGEGPSYILTQLGITDQSITKLDEYTVQIVIDQAYAPALVLACLAAPASSILDPTIVMEHAQDEDMGSAWLEEHSAGSGRFVLEEQQRRKHYTLKANERYWGEKSAIQTIIVKNVADPLEQMSMLEQGEIDLAWNLRPDEISMLATNQDVQISQTLTFFIKHIGMNLGYEPLAKAKVRNAIRYAVDYNSIIRFVLQGAAKPIQTFIPEGLLGYNPDMPYSQDLEKAKQLLEEAGYSEGFEVELKTLNFSPWIDIAVNLQRNLSEIGIKVEIVQMDIDPFWEAITLRETQMFLWEWVFDYFDPDSNAKLLAHSDSLGDDATVKTIPWWLNYVNKEAAQLVDQAAMEIDQDKRAAIYKKVTDIILHDGPHIFICSSIQQYAYSFDVAEFIGNPTVAAFDFPSIK